MDINLNYGKATEALHVEDENILGILLPNIVESESTGIEEIRYALNNPIDTPKLRELVYPGEQIVIVTSDITRPMPSKLVIPEVLNELYVVGLQDKDITIVFALGSHRPHTEEEKKYLVGEEIYNRIKCIDSSQVDYMCLGTTSRGTPVDIFTPVAMADRVICLGNIEFHYFAGYSGGAKAIMPGVSTKSAIQANHSMMVKTEAYAGNIDTNPVRMDIEEVAEFLKIDFILNVVLNEKKQIIKAVAGHHIHAHRAGCRFLDKLYKIDLSQRADIVVVSAGGYPKDINLYQAQKALDNAKQAVKPGGIIILVASCKEGLGEETFERWMLNIRTPDEMLVRIQTNFELGGHKAAAIGSVLKNADVYLVSELEPGFVEQLNLKPFTNVQTAIETAYQKNGRDAKVLIMQYGGSTLPSINK